MVSGIDLFVSTPFLFYTQKHLNYSLLEKFAVKHGTGVESTQWMNHFNYSHILTHCKLKYMEGY